MTSKIYHPTDECGDTLRYLQAFLQDVFKVPSLEFLVIFLLDSLAPSLACALAHSVATVLPMACTVQPVAHHADSSSAHGVFWSLEKQKKIVIGKAKQIMSKGRGTMAPCTIVPGVL